MYSLCSLDGGGLKTLSSWWRPGCGALMHPCITVLLIVTVFILLQNCSAWRIQGCVSFSYITWSLCVSLFCMPHALRFLVWCHINWNTLARRVFPIFNQTLQKSSKCRRFPVNACQPQHCNTSGVKDTDLLVITSRVWGATVLSLCCYAIGFLQKWHKTTIIPSVFCWNNPVGHMSWFQSSWDICTVDGPFSFTELGRREDNRAGRCKNSL